MKGFFVMSILAAAYAARMNGGQAAVTVRVYNYVGLPDDVLEKAEREGGRIFGKAGVEICWIDYDMGKGGAERRAAACEKGPADIVLNIVPRQVGDRRADILGYALLERRRLGVLAYVHYDHVRNDVALHRVPEFSLLAYAMVHEIAHLLLDQNSHARTGIMMAHWSETEMVQIERGTLSFGGGEAKMLQAGTAARNSENARD